MKFSLKPGNGFRTLVIFPIRVLMDRTKNPFCCVKTRPHGIILIYTVLVAGVLLALASLAVDYGRAQLARTELYRLADASARAAAINLSNGRVLARQAAKDIALLNPVEESTLILDDSDIEFGVWDPNNKTFTPLPDSNPVGTNAVRVTASRSSGKGNPFKLTFGPVIGLHQINISASSIAQSGGSNQTANTTVTGKANVWFAGLPSNASAAYGSDVTHAKDCPAVLFDGFALTTGMTLQFSVTGKLSNTPSGGNDPEGNIGSITSNLTNNLGGKSNIRAPMNSLIAVFLSDDDPTATPAPPVLDFSTPASRNYSTLSPQLKQTFYIGNGKRSDGQPQTIVVPPGATRLYLGSMDPWGWWNNSGTCRVIIQSTGGTVCIVR